MSKLSDYPPRIVISITLTDARSEPLKLKVIGLNRECDFEIPVSTILLGNLFQFQFGVES